LSDTCQYINGTSVSFKSRIYRPADLVSEVGLSRVNDSSQFTLYPNFSNKSLKEKNTEGTKYFYSQN
jgi:hypothetical protein